MDILSVFLCTRTQKGNMQLRLPASGARVGEDGASLLDCTRESREKMSACADGCSTLLLSLIHI